MTPGPSSPLDDGAIEAHLARRTGSGLDEYSRDLLVSGVTKAAVRQSQPRFFGWPRVAALVAALAVIVLVGGSLVLTRPHVGTVPPAGTVLDTAGLAAAVDQAGSSGTSATVLARVTLDITPLLDRLGPICIPPARCPSAVITGIGANGLDVTAADDVHLGQFLDAQGKATGIMAFHLGSETPELLGIVQAGSGGAVVRSATTGDLDDALAGQPGSAAIARGYFAEPFVSCAYSTRPFDRDSPFNGCPSSYITPTATGTGADVPPDAVAVQPNAADFAPHNSSGQPNFAIATYVLRLVVDSNPGCTSCRGWKVVGVLSGSTDSVSPPPVPTARPSDTSPQSPNPFTVDGVLTLDQLQAVITQSRSDRVSRTVVADVSLDRDAVAHMRLPPCDTDLCPVGVITGISPALLIVDAGKDVRDYLATVEPALVAGPLAIRMGPTTPELLGVVQINPNGTLNVKGDLLWPAAETSVSSLEAGTPGAVIAVRGFLVWSGPIPCPGPPSPTPPPDGPFDNCPWAWITPQAYQPWSGNSMIAPKDAIQVQWGAYDEFTPKGTESAQPSPVEGSYLLRLVADPRPNCSPCRGWKVVGIVDQVGTSPTPSPSPSAAVPVVRTPTEMSTLLSENGNAWIGHVMLVQGDIVPMGGPPCTAAPLDCPIGSFDGSDERLYPVAGATPSSVPDGGLSGTFAVRVRASGLDLLGAVDLNDQGGALWPATVTAIRAASGDVVVSGWLTATAYPCPPAPIEDQDTPFYYCADSWVTTDVVSQSDYDRGDPGFLDLDGIPVQPSAFATFTAGATDGPGLSARGTFLLHPVTAQNGTQCGPCSAWQVVARIDADPISPVASPIAEISDPVILTLDQLRTAVAGHLGARLQPQDVIADVSIDMAAGRTAVDCPDRFESCDEIGTINNATDLGAVLRREDADVQISQDVSSPIALRITDHGTLIFLGHLNVNSAGSSVSWTVPDAAAAARALPENEIVAVGGWLAGNFSTCGPAILPAPSPPAVDPFQCYGSDYLEGQPEQLYGVGGSSSSVPTGPALKLGVNEYNQFAPDPSQNLAPSLGVYLVKSVINHSNLESQACTGCRGWLVVGVVGSGPASPLPLPSPTSEAPTSAAVMTADQVRALLAASRDAPIDVVADVTIDPNFQIPCVPSQPCRRTAGYVRELSSSIFGADGDPYPDLTLRDVSAPVALHIGTDGALTFLGHVDLKAQTGLAWTVPTAGPILTSTPLGHVLAVSGWLSTQAGRNGPMPQDEPPPFDHAWADVLAPQRTGTSQQTGWASGSDFIRIQQGAYMHFAPGDHSSDGQPPQVGSYLVEHVAYQDAFCSPACDGWLMVGRLDPPTLGIDELNAALVPAQTSLPVGTIANVRGWLVDTGAPVSCPPYPAPETPPTSPWDPNCGAAWITRDQVQPWTVPFGAWQFDPPPSSIRVQSDAYDTFATDPQYEADGVAHTPRLGTYTLQLIRDPRFPVDGALAWEVVGRVDP